MANKKYTKLGIALTSLAVLGMAQAFPLDIPVIGTQVVRAEENNKTMVLTVTPYNIDTGKRMIESYDDIAVYELNQGDSIVLSAPVIEGFVYESYQIFNYDGYLKKGDENTLTITPSDFPYYDGSYNLYWGYRPSDTTPKAPATANTVNTPTDGATGEDSTGTADSGKADTPPTGDGSNTTELPTQPTDGTGADANTETSTGDNQPDTGQADASSNADTNSDNTVPTDIPKTGESEAGNKQELPTTPTDKPADNGQASKPADTGEKTPSRPADDKKTVDTPTVRPDQPSSTPTTPVVSVITFDRGPRVDASQSSTVTQVAPVMMTGADTKTTLAPTATDTPRQPLSRVDSRHLPKTGDSHSLLAIFFGLTSLTTGLFDLRKSKK